MELNKKLVMTFKTTEDNKVSISVDNPREDLSEDEIKTFEENTFKYTLEKYIKTLLHTFKLIYKYKLTKSLKIKNLGGNLYGSYSSK